MTSPQLSLALFLDAVLSILLIFISEVALWSNLSKIMLKNVCFEIPLLTRQTFGNPTYINTYI